MGGFSIWHWLVVGLVILLLFGKGRFSDMMGDVAKGLKSFKKGISEDDEATASAQQQQQQPRLAQQPTALDQPAVTPVNTATAAPVVHPAPDVAPSDRPVEPR